MDNNLVQTFKEEECDDESNLYSKTCNKLLLKKEVLERNYLGDHVDENDTLFCRGMVLNMLASQV